MLDHARHRVATGETIAGDGYTAEVLGRLLRSRAKELAEEPDGPLFFGRLRFGPDAGDHADQQYYLGRRRIGLGAEMPLVIDWRAPVSSRFYRATATDPMGVQVRRRYGWSTSPAELTGYEDEHITSGLPSRYLTEEIERPRVGPMRDIVATIQADQDQLVRADLTTSTCVQGGPGTGKTAVGLHRVAYLLYAYRERLRRDSVLVLGPNPAFLRYISAVLPTLGEVEVEQGTLDDLLDSVPVRATDAAAAAAVKHDVRMAKVLRRALYGRIRPPAEPITIADGSYRWRVPEEYLARLVVSVRREAPTYGLGRERLRARVVGLVQRQAERRVGALSAAWTQRIGRSKPVKDLLEHCWPRVRPVDLVAELLTDSDAMSAAADGILTPAEQNAIGRRVKNRWTLADALLVDEVAGLIDHPPGYTHIVVDEAQDLSPMQCRAIARRCRYGSLTVLGDVAQGTTPWAAGSWPEQLGHLGQPDASVTPLTTGFRVPAAVLELADRLLDVDVPRTRSYRTDGWVNCRHTDDLIAGVVSAVRDALRYEGSIGVITADAAAERVSAALTSVGDPRVNTIPASLAKGLEYDHVVAVEPADIVDAEPRGTNRLYVVLTRAVSRLDVVHSRPLPAALG
ncbi:AAA family ATPase [Cryptosporangium aurantiacum]